MGSGGIFRIITIKIERWKNGADQIFTEAGDIIGVLVPLLWPLTMCSLVSGKLPQDGQCPEKRTTVADEVVRCCK